MLKTFNRCIYYAFIHFKNHVFHSIYVLYYVQGKYEFNFKAIFNCNPTPNGAVIYDLYLNRKCNNATEIKGTMTSKIPIDDSFFVSTYLTKYIYNKIN